MSDYYQRNRWADGSLIIMAGMFIWLIVLVAIKAGHRQSARPAQAKVEQVKAQPAPKPKPAQKDTSQCQTYRSLSLIYVAQRNYGLYAMYNALAADCEANQ